MRRSWISPAKRSFQAFGTCMPISNKWNGGQSILPRALPPCGTAETNLSSSPPGATPSTPAAALGRDCYLQVSLMAPVHCLCACPASTLRNKLGTEADDPPTAGYHY